MELEIVATHAATARMDIHEVARQLNQHLGASLVAAMVGTPDRKLPIKWAKTNGPTPGADYSRRLQFGHRTWNLIAAAEGDHVARNWFIGANPMLSEDTPLTGIREDRLDQVAAASVALINDQPAT